MGALALCRYKQLLLLISVLCVCYVQGMAQLTAAFSATTTSGCAPIVVQFTDQSGGNPTQWRWDLGNGVISYLQHPSATYFNPGTYRIKLVISNTAGSADSLVKESFINVYPNPQVDLSASDSSGCFPLPVQFTDLSSTSSGRISSWQWDFGDGTTTTLASPLHTYGQAGSYSVTLKVVNSFGCVKTASKAQYIKVAAGVKADFTNSTAALCKAPVLMQFTNKSSGPATLSYSWDFGDGQQSTEPSPAHSYGSPGSYSVRLVVRSSQGCSDTLTKTNLVRVGAATSSFSSPAVVCAGSGVSFVNTSSPAASSVRWSFGDGTGSEQAAPVKVFSKAGVYKVKLVNSFGNCIDSVVRSVEVQPRPKVVFGAEQQQSCKAPFSVQFTNASVGGKAYKWLFGDGSSSEEASPMHTYSSLGAFSVTLIVFNDQGCGDTLMQPEFIKIQKPVITGTGLPKIGCIPLTITPEVNVVCNEPVIGYLWRFGDGTTSSEANPVHFYNEEGAFDVSLIITTVSGCSDSVIIDDAVMTAKKPKAGFTIDPSVVCAKEKVIFTDTSTSVGNINQWLWDFGDGGMSLEQNPIHIFQDTGMFSVTLIANYKTCPDTLKIDSALYIKPPIASFQFENSCNNKYYKSFKDNSVGALTRNWSFGDGSSSVEINPLHTYAAPGKYTVKLEVTNGACTNTAVQVINVIDEKSDFNITSNPVCKGNPVIVRGLNFDSSNLSRIVWNFGDGSSALHTLNGQHTYNKSGKYTVSLKITDILGCSDAKSSEIFIYGPTTDFYTESAGICLGDLKIRFIDSSKTDGVNGIVKWIWNFGDGIVDSTLTNSFDHLYTKAGVYTVSLKVVDSFGCSNVLSKPKLVTVAQPKADFISLDSISCKNKSIHFVNKSIGYTLNYNWNFGNGSIANSSDPVSNYKDTGIYTIKLVIIDKYGCKDSIIKTDYVRITYPVPSYFVSDTFGTCPPLLVNFTNDSYNYSSIKWSFGDGNSATLESPSHYYTQPGTYYAKLFLSSVGGCEDSLLRKIVVKGPTGSLEYPSLTGCNPLNVTLNAHTTNNHSFIWDYSDGTTKVSTDSSSIHTYTKDGTYLPKVILVDENNCKVAILGRDSIKVIGVEARLSLDNYKFCDSGYARFRDVSVSNEHILSWKWSFGNGKYDDKQHPVHLYKEPGKYNAQLVATTLSGCSDTSGFVTVYIYGSPVIDISGSFESCMPGELLYKGTLIKGVPEQLTWNWDFGNGFVYNGQYPDKQVYFKAGTYKLSANVFDLNSCKASINKSVEIHPTPIVSAGQDIVLCRGDSVQLQASGALYYGWNTDVSLTCYNCASPGISPHESTMYKVTGYNQFGCSNSDSVFIRVRQRFNMKASPDDSVCVGDAVMISASGADSYSWYPVTGLDNPNIYNPKARPQASTNYTVIGMDIDKCFTDTARVFIKVNEFPKVDVGPDLVFPVGTSVELKPSVSKDVVSWQWSPSYNLSCVECDTTVAKPKRNTKYTLTVKNRSGCISSDFLNIKLTCNQGNIFIPNTFSPNGDGNNDVFFPRGVGIGMIRTFIIYNRWGEVVFERLNFNANNEKLGWNGTYKNKPLSPDVYIYSCEILCENNEVLNYTGDIALIK